MRERLTYICERRKGEGEILLIVRGGKVRKSKKREIAAKNLPGTLLVLFLIFLVFPFTFHSRFSSCFREVILVDWSGH